MKVADIWDQVFEKYHILDEIEEKGFFEITSKQLKEFYEARLMAKYDFSKSMPKIFKKNHLGILPITRGKYIIGKFKVYENLKEINTEPEVVSLPSYIETIDPDNIYSEANALHVGLITRMLDKVVGEKLIQSISGRMNTDGFDFDIKVAESQEYAHIQVNKPQIEIDGGYESKKYVVLVEAKNKKSSDFIIRQLYYPYRYWSNKVSKPIIPIFFLYDSGIYTLYRYEFKDKNNYNSLKLVNAKRYRVQYEKSDENLKELFNTMQIEEELEYIPFPQADSFTKIINMMMLIYDEGTKSSKEIANDLDVVERQGYYYTSAGRYLGLIDKTRKTSCYELTSLGKNIISQEVYIRNKLLAKQVLRHKVFYLTLDYFYRNEKLPSYSIVEEYIIKYSNVMIRSKKKNQKPNTIKRRISTVLCWIQWMISTNL